MSDNSQSENTELLKKILKATQESVKERKTTNERLAKVEKTLKSDHNMLNNCDKWVIALETRINWINSNIKTLQKVEHAHALACIRWEHYCGRWGVTSSKWGRYENKLIKLHMGTRNDMFGCLDAIAKRMKDMLVSLSNIYDETHGVRHDMVDWGDLVHWSRELDNFSDKLDNIESLIGNTHK